MDAAQMPEPRTGSVVALDWGGPRQEVWVSNRANTGNWYSPDTPAAEHPTWADVVVRAKARGDAVTLLVAADDDALRAGYEAGVAAAKQAAETAIGSLP